MRPRILTLLPVSGLLLGGISPQVRGEMPQARPPLGTRPAVPAAGLRPGMLEPGSEGQPATGQRPSLPAAPMGRPPVLRPTYHRLAPSAQFAVMPAFPRCTVLPTAAYWHDREYDIMAAIQRQARQGFIPATPFPVDKDSVTASTMVASGFRVYGFVVPPSGQVLLKLDFHKPGWVRVYWVNQWGEYRPGMMIKPGEPEALYINQGKTTVAVYAIVDDPGQWATETDPFTLTAKRNFDAAHLDTQGVTINQGIWNIAPESYRLSPEHR